MQIDINYEPNEWALKAHTSHVRHLCFAGALGSGKSFAAIQELKALALENPGFTYMIARKTMPSLRDTTMKTFFSCMEDGLIPRGGHNKTNNIVTLINGSQFLFRPLDDLEKLKSLEIAGFFVDESNEIDQATYDIFKTRVRQKIKGKEPSMYRTIIALNPGEEDHWIPQLFLHVKPPNHEIYQSQTFDNIKNLPQGYIEELKATFTPDMQQRMIYGLFGKVHKGRPVYASFSRGNYISPVEFKSDTTLVRGWDFGFNHPCVVWLQIVGSQARVLAELQGKNIYLQDFIRNEILPFERNLFGDVKVKIMDFCDPRGSDESDKGKSSVTILNDHHIFPIFRRTWIEEGIKVVKHYLDTLGPDKSPNFQIHPRCKILIDGFKGGYKRLDGEEMPDKDNTYDHAQDCFVAGTKIETVSGLKNIEDIKIGDHVKTSGGYKKVLDQWSNDYKNVCELEFSNGEKLRCTPAHRFYTNRGWISADSLRYDDSFVISDAWLKKSSITESNLDSTLVKDITNQAANGLKKESIIYTDMFGHVNVGQYQMATMSIIKTKISITTQLKIWNVLKLRLIAKNIKRILFPELLQKSILKCLKRLDHSLQNGMDQIKVLNGIVFMEKRFSGLKLEKIKLKKHAHNVIQNIWLILSSQFKKMGQSFVLINVNQHGEGLLGLMILKDSVSYAKPLSSQTNIQNQLHAQNNVRLLSRKNLLGKEKVYDLTVEDAHEFFANGVLVHNCLRYALLHCNQRAKIAQLSVEHSKIRKYTNNHTGRIVEY